MAQTDQNPLNSPFHRGEIAMQRSVGMDQRMVKYGTRFIRDYMPDQHREFFAQLPFMVIAGVDDDGNVWPTIVAGRPGFMRSPDPTHLQIDAMPFADDPALRGIGQNRAIGMLGIELHSRRRNRMNGVIRNLANGGMEIEVQHSFGNCPRYIHPREFSLVRDPAVEPAMQPEISTRLNDEARAIIQAADTFFVASYADRKIGRQVDVSHRGGQAGFVRLDPDGTLTIPDYAGNFYFNTLGNIYLNPRAGLLFIDFASGDMLQLAGSAAIITDAPQVAKFADAQRLWNFRPTQIILRRRASALLWQKCDAERAA